MNFKPMAFLKSVVALFLGTWKVVAPNPKTIGQPTPVDTAYGDGKYVAICNNDGHVLVSTDAVNWTRYPALAGNWRSITYGAGLFVAVGVGTVSGSYCMTSPDGINWTLRNTPANNSWTCVVFASSASAFVAVSSDGTARSMRSADGITWQLTGATLDSTWYSVATNGSNLFIAVAYLGTTRTMYSTDGYTWTGVNAPAAVGWVSITYNPVSARFVAVANNGTSANSIMHTTNGTTWTLRSFSLRPWVSVSTNTSNGYSVAIASDGSTAYSTTGTAWTNGTLLTTSGWTRVSGVNDILVAVCNSGNQRIATTAGVTWTQVNTEVPVGTSFRGIAFGNGVFVAVSQGTSGYSNKKVHTSPDGINWTLQTGSATSVSTTWNSVAFGNGKFVAVGSDLTLGAGNSVMYSTDGISWTGLNPAAGIHLLDITFYNGKFYAVGNLRILDSADGITWNTVVYGDKILSTIAGGNGKLVAGPSDSGTVSVDVNGNNVTWANFATGLAATATHIAFLNGTFFFMNGTSQYATSTNGTSWTVRACPASGAFRTMAFGNGTFLAISNTVGGSCSHRSTDGINWVNTNDALLLPDSYCRVVSGGVKFVAVSNLAEGKIAYND